MARQVVFVAGYLRRGCRLFSSAGLGEVDTHPYLAGGHKPRHIARNLNTHACTSESFEESL